MNSLTRANWVECFHRKSELSPCARENWSEPFGIWSRWSARVRGLAFSLPFRRAAKNLCLGCRYVAPGPKSLQGPGQSHSSPDFSRCGASDAGQVAVIDETGAMLARPMRRAEWKARWNIKPILSAQWKADHWTPGAIGRGQWSTRVSTSRLSRLLETEEKFDPDNRWLDPSRQTENQSETAPAGGAPGW